MAASRQLVPQIPGCSSLHLLLLTQPWPASDSASPAASSWRPAGAVSLALPSFDLLMAPQNISSHLDNQHGQIFVWHTYMRDKDMLSYVKEQVSPTLQAQPGQIWDCCDQTEVLPRGLRFVACKSHTGGYHEINAMSAALLAILVRLCITT